MTFIIIAFIILGYFLPSLIAAYRSHNDKIAVIVTNVFFGWTGLGWVAALIWSCTGNVKRGE